jgi:hypothetical protein
MPTNTVIETMQAFERLPVGSVINLRRTNSATVRWTQDEAGLWSEPGSEDKVATRYFRGAIEAGFISLGDPGTDEGGWEVGAWFMTHTDNGYRYLVTDADDSGNVHNCLQISNYRADRSVLQEATIAASYTRVDRPTGAESGGWFGDALAAIIPKPKVPEDLVAGLVTYAGKVEDDDLFTLLDKSGVDTAPRITVTATGETVIDGATLNMQVGATATLSEVRVPWTQVIDGVRAKRGCLCDTAINDAVLDMASVMTMLPPNYDEDSLAFVITCPVHAEK